MEDSNTQIERFGTPGLGDLAIGIASFLVLIVLFYGSRYWGDNFGYWISATYWIFSIIGGVVLYLAEKAYRVLTGAPEYDGPDDGADFWIVFFRYSCIGALLASRGRNNCLVARLSRGRQLVFHFFSVMRINLAAWLGKDPLNVRCWPKADI